MARARFVVRDLSVYVAPVGGRCPKWGVLDTKLSTHRRPFYRDTCETRGEARKRAASRNRSDKDLEVLLAEDTKRVEAAAQRHRAAAKRNAVTVCTDDPAMFDVAAPSCESF